jgi:hypothetical protein
MVGNVITAAVIPNRISWPAYPVSKESADSARPRRGTVVAVQAGMDTQLMLVGAGGVLLLAFVFQVFRSTRGDMNHSAVSEAWLAERKRMKDEIE